MRYRVIAAFAGIIVLAAGCAMFSQRVDVPKDVGAAYAAREAAFMVEGDSCGPAFVQEKLPGYLKSAIEPLADGPFRPVCARHDACYRMGEKAQAWCDDRMLEEMLAICDTGAAGLGYSIPEFGPSLCRFHGGMYFRLINSTYGGVAFGGAPGGEIAALRTRTIADRGSDDEVEVCVDIRNPTMLMQEYDVELHDARGRRIDREPDLFEENIRAGETETLCVSTNWDPRFSKSDVADGLFISVRADTPESFAFWDDMVVVDQAEVGVD